jgi:hypothetical protein
MDRIDYRQAKEGDTCDRCGDEISRLGGNSAMSIRLSSGRTYCGHCNLSQFDQPARHSDGAFNDEVYPYDYPTGYDHLRDISIK